MSHPESKIPESLEQVKWNRYHQSLPKGDAHMKDFRPRTFIKRMKLEILVFSCSILMGIFWVPWYFSNERRAMRASDPQHLQKQSGFNFN